MPIVHFVNNKSQSEGGMKTVLGYVSQEKKTVREDRKYVTGINCSPQSSYEEMMLTKRLYNKTSGRLYYHLVQSFPKGYDITPELAHKIACEYAEKAFGKYECVVATHIDRAHIHSHIVFNSVSFEDGKKYHSNLDSVKELMKLSDDICLRYGVPVLDDPAVKLGKNKVTKMSDREFRAADKGQSVKLQLMSAITNCMREAKSRKQFCWLMKNKYGISTKWQDNRKYITYTTPNGYRCRDKRLHEDKYLKEAMENEFRIRHEILDGEEQTRLAGGSETDHNDSYHRADEQLSAQSGGAVGTEQGGGHSLAETDSRGHLGGDDGLVVTGWEPEREVLLLAERARRLAAEGQQTAYQGRGDLTIGAAGIIGGIADLASIIDNAPTDPEELERYIDAQRAAQNAGLLIGAAVAAIEILSERL